MAQLHRRILRFPHPRRLAPVGLVLAALAVRAAPARAQDAEGGVSLAAEARALRAPSTRDAAIERLCNLPADSLPAIRERIAEIRGTRATGDAGYAALGELGAAAGAQSPSDPRDLLPGLLAFPDDRFSATHQLAAERYCLLRSLDRMGTAEALVAALPLVTFDIRALRWQARHLVRRAGKRSTAMVIRAASHPNPEVDLWAGWALQALAIRGSGDSVQDQSEESLIEVLRAYASVRHIGGMPVVASFVDDPRPTVRAAARDALALYGENSIWELRRLFQTRLGQDPGNRSWQVLLRDLGRGLDDRREAPLRERAARAVEAANAGKLDEAARLADELLVTAPTAEASRALAPVFLARARAAAAEGRIDEARSMVERAIRLGGDSPDPTALVLREQVRDAEWVRHGIVEERDDRALVAADATQASIAARRRYAHFGFVAAFLLLSLQTLVAVLRRSAREARVHGATLGQRLLASYRAGGRARIEAFVRSFVARAAETTATLARRAMQAPRTEQAPMPVAQVAPVARVPSREPVAVETNAEPVEAPLVHEPTPAFPSTPAHACETPGPKLRRERPTRRAVADAGLFTAARPAAARQRAK